MLFTLCAFALLLLQTTHSFTRTHSLTSSMPTHPLGELRVHHEVVYMFLGLGQLQLPGYHGNHQSRTARTLWETRGEGGREEDRVSQYRGGIGKSVVFGQGISSDDWREQGQIWRWQKEKWMGERRGLGGIALFQIHISSCWEASQIYFHLQSIWCEMPSISPL